MLDSVKEVQGIAIYAQFHKPGAMSQFLITPDGYDESGTKVAASIYRRAITHDTPKKQWKVTHVRPRTTVEGLDPEDENHRAQSAMERLDFATQLFDTLITGKWEIHKSPIFLEVSQKDMTDVRAGKTPTKLIYRVNLVRDASDYTVEIPEKE
jgi:hypothetical protein